MLRAACARARDGLRARPRARAHRAVASQVELDAPPRILVVGGTGVFGGKLVEGLLATTRLHVVVGCRTPAHHRRVLDDWRARFDETRLSVVVLDREAVSAEALRALRLFAVVDAAGPFQGTEPTLAREAVRARCHYVDLCDARDFIAAFPAKVDALAREAGVVAVTGASSSPAISLAVVNQLARAWRKVDSVEVSLIPGNRAPRGESVVRSILSYAGRPLRVLVDGEWQQRAGWSMPRRVAAEGVAPRWASLCDTAELDLVAAARPEVRHVVFRAGVELAPLHLGLWALTLLVRLGLVRSLEPLARPLLWCARPLERLGSDVGAMVVEMTGRDEDEIAVTARWELVARGGDGPNIPALPALALLRDLVNGRVEMRGAVHAGQVLRLPEIEAEFARFRIRTIFSGDVAPPPLLQRALGSDAFARLAPRVRELHSPNPAVTQTGRAQIDGAASRLGALVGRLFGFPPSGSDVSAHVVVARGADGSERWTRRFGSRAFVSHLSLDASAPGRVSERFGPLSFAVEVRPRGEGFEMVPVAWRLGPLSLPRALMPRSVGTASLDSQQRYAYDVLIELPLLGRLVRYRGWLRDP